MEPEKVTTRLDALDGLRGVAILLVALSHLELSVLFDKGSHLFTQVFFDSGEVGVSLLFILSGFLMSYLYPHPKNTLAFLQKRYTRIFPAFLAVCLVLSITSVNSWVMQDPPKALSWLFGAALLFYGIWVYGVKRIAPIYGKVLFILFLVLQILVGLFYLFWIMGQPLTHYLDQVPLWVRTINNGLINATLTLPLGTYHGPLSSVYWSLGTEVYFYILYPLLAVPFMRFLAPISKQMKILILGSLLLLFFALYLLSHRLLFFSLLHIELAFYFVGGLTLGYFYRADKQITILNHSVVTKGSIVFLPLMLIFNHLAIKAVPVDLQPFVQTALTIPFTLLVLLSLNHSSSLAKLLSTKLLIYIGTISYSLYLIHMYVYELVKYRLGDPTDVLGISIYILVSLISAIAVASGLYYLLERPYFKKRIDQEKRTSHQIDGGHEQRNQVSKPLFLTISLFLILSLSVFFAYNSDFKLLSLQSSHYKEEITKPAIIENPEHILLNDHPYLGMQFQATEANLSVFEFDLKGGSNPDQEFIPLTLMLRLREVGTAEWKETKIHINTRDDVLPKLFGFEPIADSAGKNYELELVLDHPESAYQITLHATHFLFKAHYNINKSELSNPQIISKLATNKIISTFSNPEAQVVILLLLPFFLLSGYLIFRKNHF